ncbi:low molecular weight protein tyrosine phosphatase [Bacillus sp. JCM 19046]|nr:low molecular weight protein tyrosine phosphatase [Bacillus sp. JCM 19045]GAF16812.1 low molecular weight protein tyrosine phosphatase [Bacillus sp. JCM 19046]
MKKKRVLFVCTGNTCRSPLAEVYLNHLASDQYEAKSAGVFAGVGAPISTGSAAVLQEEGIVFNHRSQPVSAELMEWADVVLTMSSSHKQLLNERYPRKSIQTLKEAVGDEASDIADPFGGSIEQYLATANEIKSAIERFLKQTKT